MHFFLLYFYFRTLHYIVHFNLLANVKASFSSFPKSKMAGISRAFSSIVRRMLVLPAFYSRIDGPLCCHSRKFSRRIIDKSAMRMVRRSVGVIIIPEGPRGRRRLANYLFLLCLVFKSNNWSKYSFKSIHSVIIVKL